MKSKKIALIIIAAFTSLSMFAGCAASPAKSAVARETTAAYYGEGAPADSDGEWAEEVDTAKGRSFLGINSAQRASGAAKQDISETQAAAPAEAGTGNQNSNQSQSQTNIDPEKGRLLIRTVTMAAETKEFEKARQAIEDKVKELGGYIENSGVSGTGKTGSLRRASYKIRVPADKLDELITTVGSGCTVTSSNENTSDVTLNYVDTKAKLESLRVEQKQLTELLSQAKDLDSIIVLQDRLTQVRYQIESAESTLRVLENQVSYSTLTLNIREVMEIKPQEEPHVESYGEKVARTFKESLHNIGEFFKGLFLVLVAVSPVIVPMTVITIIVVVIIVSSVKRKRKKRAAEIAEKEAQYRARLQAQANAQAQPKTEAKAEEKKDGEKK